MDELKSSNLVGGGVGWGGRSFKFAWLFITTHPLLTSENQGWLMEVTEALLSPLQFHLHSLPLQGGRKDLELFDTVE